MGQRLAPSLAIAFMSKVEAPVDLNVQKWEPICFRFLMGELYVLQLTVQQFKAFVPTLC
ncbi:hypothetical protein KIN20_000325 [Parelaphostrongylus tenuis]|uniref:Uncharacterized protein n=1 Tax=Parelaphostrongylus tenuis TaxID=148309 RepID=A0AAD5QDT0_PARTN|nr:hypothetical protein KIN20_000325 [Parelaphostrongylus tenuis]